VADRIGYIDFIRDRQIQGWALDREDPEQPVRIELRIDSTVLGTVVADMAREDLTSARIGTGRHGFALAIPPVFPVSRRSVVRAHFAGTASALERSGETAAQLVADNSVQFEDDRSPWDALARHNPMWHADGEDEDAVSERFFLRGGADEVRERLQMLTRLYGPLPARELALDFGCGSGRLTLPLARRFEQVIAFDLSGRMLAYAAQHCVQEGLHNVIFCRTLESLAGHVRRGIDLLLAIGVFPHVEEAEGRAVLAQLLDAMRDGARGCVELLVGDAERRAAAREVDLGPDGVVTLGRYAYDMNATMALMQEAGVRDLHAELLGTGAGLSCMLHFRKGRRGTAR
jgi:SAM-dependent methyltransferase